MSTLAKQNNGDVAIVGEKIKSLSPAIVEEGLLPILIRASQILGYKADLTDMVFICGELQQLLSGKYSFLPMQSVERAIINGATGEYDEVKSISVRGIHTWIRAFMADESSGARKESMKPNEPCHVIAGSLLSELVKRNPAFGEFLSNAGSKGKKL